MITESHRATCVERARRYYESELRDKLTQDHLGSIITIDGRTLKYAIGVNGSQSASRLREICEDPITYTARIGSDYVYDVPSATILSGDSN